MQTRLPFFTLLLMISFASVNAVLFTPALPQIATYFGISDDTVQWTITWFLIGYALGQLLYGPIANRYGRKPALYAGILLQILSSLACVIAGKLHNFDLLIVARFALALGSGVGLKMTFTLVNECYEPKAASKKVAYLMLAFAITPGLAVALGGILTTHFDWMSCFYALAIYGIILLLLTTRLPETLASLDKNAFNLRHLSKAYGAQFKNISLLSGGILMGACTGFVYLFAAEAPLLAINLLGMSTAEYGLANLLPPIGLALGSICSAKLTDRHDLSTMIKIGIVIATLGSLLMLTASLLHLSPWYSLFITMVLIYFGLSFIMANASALAMSHVKDKAHGSAVMSFMNMGFATLLVLSLGWFPLHSITLPSMYLALVVLMFLINTTLRKD